MSAPKPTDWDIANAMQASGGRFVQLLGELFQVADEVNRAKLKAAFAEYWDEYAELVELHWEHEAKRKLTRHEQLEGLADRGVDTWEDYRGER